MINKLLQFIAPHYCYGCGQIGTVLCANCKYDIIEDGFDGCIVCARPALNGICYDCQTHYSRAWCVAERSGILRHLIDVYKFERAKDIGSALGELLDVVVPVLPSDAIIVPVPTLSSHIRQRGYDQTKVIADSFSSLRSLPVAHLLEHVGKTAQRGMTKRRRFAQANASFRCNKILDDSRTYILIDDVVTTNATIGACAAELRRAGAGDVWVVVVARQPLDK